MIPQPTMSPSSPNSTAPSCGGQLVSIDGRTLPLRSTALKADASAGLARVALEQTYTNPYTEPLRVTYQVPLPADGAVSGFSFLIDGKETIGRVETLQAAREQFEQALVEGRTAALLEQDRSSLFTQEVGNIPPKATVVVRIEVDQRLAWRDEEAKSGWEWRFPTVVAPRFLGQPSRVPDAGRISVDVSDGETGVAMSLELTVRDAAGNALPSSPSHTLVIEREGDHRICQLGASAALDRDVVVQWPAAQPNAGVTVDTGRPAEGPTAAHAYAMLTVTPPQLEPLSVPRDLIVLLDTSGSMHGEPIGQAKRVVAALIDSLSDRDQVELIEFSTAPHRFKPKAVTATASNRMQAHAWLQTLQAGGGTMMRDGIMAALEGLRAEAQRQIVLITDGLIGFENEIIDEVANRLPKGSRLHTIGVGSAVNRSLTGPASRAGRGVEVIIGLGEDPERATQRVLSRTRAPLVVDVSIEGDALLETGTRHLPDLFAASPVMLAARVRPEGGPVVLRGRTESGMWEQRLSLKPMSAGEGSAALAATFARERVEDLEVQAAAGHGGADVDAEITRLGLEYQISTRLTSWVAVAEEVAVDPRDPTRHEVMPQELPHGVSVAGLGLRGAGGMPMPPGAPMAASFGAAEMSRAAPAPAKGRGLAKKVGDAVGGLFRRRSRAEQPPAPSAPRGGRPAGPPPAPGAAPPPPPRQSKPQAEYDADDLADAEISEEGYAGGGSSFKEFDDRYDEPEPAGVRRFAGRFKLLSDRWVIEIDVAQSLDWELPTELVITLADGRTLTVAVRAPETTRAGKLLSGATVRVSLEPDPAEANPAPSKAQFQTPDGSTWRIDLTRGG